MASLKTIEASLKEAMKARDSFRTETLRMVKAAMKNQEIDSGKAVEEADGVVILTKMVKQRKDSADQYEKAGRSELAEQELQEIKLLQEFLPKPLTTDEVKAMIEKAKSETGASAPSDMGKLMGALKGSTQGRFDGKELAALVKQALN